MRFRVIHLLIATAIVADISAFLHVYGIAPIMNVGGLPFGHLCFGCLRFPVANDG
jgi:hypothetical protein